MNIPKLHYLYLLILIVIVGSFSLLASSSPRPVHAQDEPTPPRNVFVNNTCGDKALSEHIRFGNEKSHFFQFLGKDGTGYKVSTNIFATDASSISIDTKLLIYRDNPLSHSNQQPIAQNDDRDPPVAKQDDTNGGSNGDAYESELEFLATETRQYWIEVQNLVSDGRGSYCLKIEVIDATNLKGPDKCEFNNTIATACEIEIKARAPAPTLQSGVPIPTEVPEPVPIKMTPAPSSSAGSYVYNFYPTGSESSDLDYYKLWMKKDQHYICQTYDLSPGNDTFMTLFNKDGVSFGDPYKNDDIAPGNKASKVSIKAPYDGWLNILVNPYVTVDRQNAQKYSYRFACINELDAEGNPTADSNTGPDICEANDSFDLASACQIILKNEKGGTPEGFKISGTLGKAAKPDETPIPYLNFAPWSSGIRDIDYYKLWSKKGWQYACFTDELQNGNDTKMSIFYYARGEDDPVPGDNPNDDYNSAKTGLESRVEVSHRHTVDGWLIVKVEPAMEYIFEDGGDYQYQLTCEATAPPNVPLTNLNGEEGTQWEATRDPYSTTPTTTAQANYNPAESETAVPVVAADQNAQSQNVVSAAATPQSVAVALAANRPVNVSFVALPPSAPTPAPPPPTQAVEFALQVYYDQNNNQLKETGEGVSDVPVYIYTGLFDTPLEASTNAGGAIFFKGTTINGKVLIVIPYLGISREIAVDGTADIRLRIAPQR